MTCKSLDVLASAPDTSTGCRIPHGHECPVKSNVLQLLCDSSCQLSEQP